MVKHGKKHEEALIQVDKTKIYSPEEAVELAKMFGGESSPRFVNGVLGSLVLHFQEIVAGLNK